MSKKSPRPRVLRGHTTPVTSVEFHNIVPNKLFSASSGGELYVWDTSSHEFQALTCCESESILSVQCAADNDVFVQYRGGIIQVVDVVKDKSKCELRTEAEDFCVMDHIDDVVVSTTADSEKVGMWDIRTGDKVKEFCSTDETPHGLSTSVALLDDTQVVAGFEDGSICLWDMRNEGETFREKIHSAPECGRRSRTVVSGSADNVISIMSLQEKSNIVSRKRKVVMERDGINSVKLRKDEKLLVSAGWDRRVRLFTRKSVKPLAVLKYHDSVVTCIAFSSDDLLASGGGHLIALWPLYQDSVL